MVCDGNRHVDVLGNIHTMCGGGAKYKAVILFKHTLTTHISLAVEEGNTLFLLILQSYFTYLQNIIVIFLHKLSDTYIGLLRYCHISQTGMSYTSYVICK